MRSARRRSGWTRALLSAETSGASAGRGNYAQPRDTLELVCIAGHDAHPVRQCGGGDPEVVRADELTFGRQLGPHFGVNPRDLLRDLDRPKPAEQVLDERSTARALGAAGSVHAVQQFADADDTDRPVLAS